MEIHKHFRGSDIKQKLILAIGMRCAYSILLYALVPGCFPLRHKYKLVTGRTGDVSLLVTGLLLTDCTELQIFRNNVVVHIAGYTARLIFAIVWTISTLRKQINVTLDFSVCLLYANLQYLLMCIFKITLQIKSLSIIECWIFIFRFLIFNIKLL